MKFYTQKIYPLIALLSGILIMSFGLVAAQLIKGSYFLLAVFGWLLLLGYAKQCCRVLPILIVIGGIFAGIAYGASKVPLDALKMANRFAAIFLGIVPSMSVETIRVTRSLSQLHTPRFITLGMLIATSFVPMLKTEIKRVREAMKTRGTGSVLNPKIFYRAFLVPFVMRLINISDTLALSVELRGFTLGKCKYTVYKKEKLSFKDMLFVLPVLAGCILVVVL